MITFSNNVSKKFVYEFIPDLIYSLIVHNVDEHKFDAMDEYLKTNIGIDYSTIGLIRFALDNLEIKEVNGTYQIEVSNVIKINDYTLHQLMRLIDYGNNEVKGTRVFRDACNYIEGHKAMVIDDYNG